MNEFCKKIRIGDVEVVHPDFMPSTEWIDNMKMWPNTEAPQIVCYLVNSKACDLHDMQAYKSLESYNYLASGWVGKLLFCKINDKLCYLRGSVSPSQSLSEKDHTAWICAEYNGEIKVGGCTCMAGLGKVCSHVGAILWKIDMANKKGLTGMSCTDESSRWNVGTKRNIEVSSIDNISFKKPNRAKSEIILEKSGVKSNLSFPIQHYSKEDMQLHWKKSNVWELTKIPGTLLHAVANAEVKLPMTIIQNRLPMTVIQNQTVKLNVNEKHGQHTGDTNITCQLCLQFYNKFIKLDLQKISDLDDATKEQSKSRIWKESRRLRVTGSTANKVPKKENTNPEKFLLSHLYKPFRGNLNTKHGNKYENIARCDFTKTTGIIVNMCGTVVSESEPWLSASPDGLIGSEECLEIKCPVTTDLTTALKKADVIDHEQKLILNPKGKNGYYLQLQLIMFCCKRRKAWFIVWTLPKEEGSQHFAIISVLYNKNYVEQHLKKLRTFYFTKMLPRLIDDYTGGALSISNEYKKFVQ